MSEVLEKFPVGVGVRGRNGCYVPFLDGRIHRVVNGIDFHVADLNGVRNAFYVAANRRGLAVRVHVESHDPITVIVQASPKKNS